MGNSVSRVVGCFVPATQGQERVAVFFSEPLDEGLGHSFCYVRPVLDSPHLSPNHSDRFGVIALPLDSETRNGSFRLSHENADDTQKLKSLAETTFKSISGASVSANTYTPRTIGSYEQFNSFANVSHDRAAAFESTASFSSLPLQPVPRGVSNSGPIPGPLSGPASGSVDRGFFSGPLERGFLSGPLERGFMSGPLERGSMSGPIDLTDRSHFSAPLTGGLHMPYFRRRRSSLVRLVKTVSKPVKKALSRTLSKTSSTLARTQRSLVAPVKHLVWGHGRDVGTEVTTIYDGPLDMGYISSGVDAKESRNLQWAQGKAGEDRVHVVLSEEHGWLFVGIYDGFNGPDATDFLMSNLYRAIYRELRGLLWDRKEDSGFLRECDQGEQIHWKVVDNSPAVNVEGGEASTEGCCRGVYNEGGGLGTDLRQLNVLDLADRNCKVEQGGPGVSTFVRQNDGSESAETDLCSYVEPHQMQERCGGCLTEVEPEVTGKGVQEGQCHMHFQEALTKDHASQHDECLREEIDTDASLRKNFAQGQSSVDTRTVNERGDGIRDRSESACDRTSVDSGSNSAFELADESVPDNYTKNVRRRKYWKAWRGGPLFRSIKQTHGRRKENDKKLFLWRRDWEQHDKETGKGLDENLKQEEEVKQSRYGDVDHPAILRALARALEVTEAAYLEMADQALDENPELALMGSCVLVMLMKDENVYVLNVGDSRAILAQQLRSEHHGLQKQSRDIALSHNDISTVDSTERVGARESLLRLELEKIIEETPTDMESTETSNLGPPATGLSLSALQLSTDHSTSIEEEVSRIKAEHPDDDKSIFNDRVKGRLKVTRAFGAGFLKKPKWNSALLGVFRVDYVGTTPYISCTPSLHHHRVGPNDHFLVLSSDGLYQYLSNEEVVSHVEWFMKKFPDGDPAQYLIEELLFRAAKKAGMDFHELLDIPHGDRRKYHDDVSVMVISLEGRIWRSSG